MKCSAVVLSYNRIANLGRIVENLQRREWIEDIVVWHQGVRLHGEVPGLLGTRLFVARPNRFRLGRFNAMDHCRNDAVLVQDDDVLPRNLDELWETWKLDRSSIAALLAKGHLATDPRRRWLDCHEVLLGWGAILDRRWRHVFKLWRHSYGDDMLLERKADRIFSILQQRPHHVLLADYEKLPGADANDAAWKQPDHDSATIEVRERCLNGILSMNIVQREYRRR